MITRIKAIGSCRHLNMEEVKLIRIDHLPFMIEVVCSKSEITIEKFILVALRQTLGRDSHTTGVAAPLRSALLLCHVSYMPHEAQLLLSDS